MRLRETPRVRIHTPLDEAQSCAIGTVEIEGIEPGPLQAYLFNMHRIFTTPIVHDQFKGRRDRSLRRGDGDRCETRVACVKARVSISL